MTSLYTLTFPAPAKDELTSNDHLRQYTCTLLDIFKRNHPNFPGLEGHVLCLCNHKDDVVEMKILLNQPIAAVLEVIKHSTHADKANAMSKDERYFRLVIVAWEKEPEAQLLISTDR